MNCLAQRKRFKNKHPAWSDPADPQDTATATKQVVEQDDAQVAGENDVDDDSSSDEDDMYANDVRTKNLSLEVKELLYKHLANINNERSFKGPVKHVEFHPTSKMAAVALGTGQIDLFAIDGEKNRYIQNIKVPPTKEPFCSFNSDNETIVIVSETYKGAFFSYNMMSSVVSRYELKVGRQPKPFTDFVVTDKYIACRKEGSREVFVLSSKTFEVVHTIKLNEPVVGLQFISNDQLVLAGGDANVYIWDLRNSLSCKHRFQDEGAVHTSSIALSKSSNQLSIGSDSGIVNTYQLEDCLNKKYPTPLKTCSNLKSAINILKYNGTGELLLFGSDTEPGSFRLCHSHSGTVYKNFPVPGKKYGHLICANFSPLSGYLGLGTSNGRAHLCRIPYYKSY